MIGRLVFLALVVAAVWYGSKHYKALLPKNTGGEIEVVNISSRTIEAFRASVGETAVAIEVLEAGASRKVPFQPRAEGPFHLVWASRGVLGERTWTSSAPATTAPQVHRFDIGDNGAVSWSSTVKEQVKAN
jgi:hypothetical protein